MSGKQEIPTSVRFYQEELDELQVIATEKNMSRGELIRRIVRVGLPSARLTIPAKDIGGSIRPAVSV